MNRYRMLALDIDGTILTSQGTIAPRVHRAITRAMRAGMMVTLATGRNWRAALPVAQQLVIHAPIVVSNGALVIEPTDRQILLHRPLPTALGVRAVRMLQWMGFTTYASSCDLNGPDLFHEQAPAIPEMACLFKREPEFVRQVFDLAGHVAGMHPLKVMAMDRTEAIGRAAERLQRDLEGPFEVLITAESPGFSLLEVAPAGISKATGLERIAALNAIAPSEVIAFGDNLNDLEMLQWAGLGVAMGNSPDEVRRVAAAVTGSNDEDGVALFLERRILQAA